jgi:hypothetical protein
MLISKQALAAMWAPGVLPRLRGSPLRLATVWALDALRHLHPRGPAGAALKQQAPSREVQRRSLRQALAVYQTTRQLRTGRCGHGSAGVLRSWLQLDDSPAPLAAALLTDAERRGY